MNGIFLKLFYLFAYFYFSTLPAHQILLVSSFHKMQKRDFNHRLNNKNEVLPLYCQAWKEVIETLEKKGSTITFVSHFFFKNNWKLYQNYDLYIFHDFGNYDPQNDLDHIFLNSMLIMFEPPAVKKNVHNLEFINKFQKVLSWDDDLVDNRKIFKFYYVVLRDALKGPSFNKRKFACLIAGNKKSDHPSELYSERIRILKYYSTKTMDFNLFGHNWGDLYSDIYQGSCSNKLDILKQYKFNFCLENSSLKPGYITEKIFDSFACGTIPIYKGPPNIDEYIPKNCYIDFSSFESLDDLHKYLTSIEQKDYESYLSNIRQFLDSEKAKLFTKEKFKEILSTHLLEILD